ncbi:MAG: S41 family peptidase [Lachnospiraceae bacterium]|nr:S41 family peptidase [Candidatus Darwinimomas equi]
MEENKNTEINTEIIDEAETPAADINNDRPVQPVNPVKDGNFGRGMLAGACVALGLLLLIGGIAALIIMLSNPQIIGYKNTEPTEIVTSEGNSLNIPRVENKLLTIQEIVNKYFLFEQDPQHIEDGIYKGYMSGLDDKYAAYYSRDEFKKLNESLSGKFFGIGAVVQQNADTGAVEVVSVIEDSPAEKAGVNQGDIIYKVDGEYASGIDFDTLVYDMIRGEKGTEVVITFIRDGKEIDIPITRGEVNSQTVYSEMKDGNIGYIEVSRFEDVTVEDFRKALDTLRDQGAKGYIIDLRDNPGGVLTAAVRMIDYILPDGVREHEGLIVYTANRDGVGERYFANDGHQVDLPIVVLVNGNSASASEVFTGAMIDYKWATIVGTQTFGKGIVQNVINLADGSAIKLTTEHYYTPDGVDLHGEGLKPDIVVELNEECKRYTDENDNQYSAAVKALEK